MKRTIEIQAGFSGVVSRGSFENEKPLFHLREVIELDGHILTDDDVANRARELGEIAKNLFKEVALASEQERIQKDYKHIRFYDCNGKKVPSVTSIIRWETLGEPTQEMRQWFARGTVIDKQVEVFLATGVWKEPKDIPEIYPEVLLLKDAKISLDGYNFKEFFKRYPFKVLAVKGKVVNPTVEYGGEYDVLCQIDSNNTGEWAKVEGVLYDVPTILDIKTGSIDKDTYLEQQVAYADCLPDVKQVGLIPLNNSTQQGFSKPVIEKNFDKYRALFLRDRENFRKRYGL